MWERAWQIMPPWYKWSAHARGLMRRQERDIRGEGSCGIARAIRRALSKRGDVTRAPLSLSPSSPSYPRRRDFLKGPFSFLGGQQPSSTLAWPTFLARVASRRSIERWKRRKKDESIFSLSVSYLPSLLFSICLPPPNCFWCSSSGLLGADAELPAWMRYVD